MSLHVRPAAAEDLPFVLSLAGRFGEFPLPEWRTPQEIEQTTRAVLDAAVNEAISTLLIAEDDGMAAGFIHLQLANDFFTGEAHGHISEIAVAPEHQRKGIARRLMAAAETWAGERGLRRLTLNAFAGNERARALYESLGFEIELVKYAKVVCREP